jgi:type I restriction enzyme S subunit
LYLHRSYYGSGRPILRIDDFQNGWVRSLDELSKVEADEGMASTYGLREGDLVINRVNSMTHLGKCTAINLNLIGVLFESNMMRAPISKLVMPRYVELYLHSEYGKRRLTRDAKWAVNQASINQEDVKRTALPLPPVPEQEAIIEAVEEQLSMVDHLETDLAAKLGSAQGLRQSLLRHAFTGRLVSQDPADEPAAVLLARIAAARSREAAAKKAKPKGTRGGRRGRPPKHPDLFR